MNRKIAQAFVLAFLALSSRLPALAQKPPKPPAHAFLSPAQVELMLRRQQNDGCGDEFIQCIELDLQIGRRYELGEGLAQDFRKAAAWYVDAARLVPEVGTWGGEDCPSTYLPDPRPFAAMARLYEEGKGLPQSLPEAYKWYLWADFSLRWYAGEEGRNWQDVADKMKVAVPAISQGLARVGPQLAAQPRTALEAAIRGASNRTRGSGPKIPDELPRLDAAMLAAIIAPQQTAVSDPCGDDDDHAGWRARTLAWR